MELISDEKIAKTLEIAQKHKWEHGAHPIFEVEKELLQAQLKADQEQVNELFEKIEKHFNDRDKRHLLILETHLTKVWWQALKKEYVK